jgi:pyruvate formate lyase activating enzyme
MSESGTLLLKKGKALDTLVCQLCPRECALRTGQRGFCGVRQHDGTTIRPLSYGLAAAIQIDPIEKKPFSHVLPGSHTFSIGTAGCNLRCAFCQNASLSQPPAIDGRLRGSVPLPPNRIAALALANHCRSVAFTFNDPVVSPEYVRASAQPCREAGLMTLAVTAGYLHPKAYGMFFEFLDAINVDLKAFSEDFYRRYTQGRLAPVLSTLLHIQRRTQVFLEVTTLLIPGLNDGDEQVRDLCAWLMGELGPQVPLHFSAFRPVHRMPEGLPTPRATLVRAKAIAEDQGLCHVYLGNIGPGEHTTVGCATCKHPVLTMEERIQGFDGVCIHCGNRVTGIWDSRNA